MDDINIQWLDKKINNQKHHFFLPSPCCRALIIGESGCGKTNLMLKLLLLPKWLDYQKLFIFGKSLHQPEYKLIKSAFDKGYSKSEILEMFKTTNTNIDQFIKQLPIKRKNKVFVNYFEDSESIPDPKDINSEDKNLFIFDDVMTNSNQSKAESYYTRGRHNNISSCYISQNYYKLPRQTIRSNANCLIIFSLPNKDLQHLYNDFISKDMSFDEFKSFCNSAWKNKHGYIIINKSFSPLEGKYLTNFNSIYLPKKFL